MDYRIADANAAAFGLPTRMLMESAGKSIAERVAATRSPRTIAVLCGTGNNGGDGFVAARYLESLADVTVILARDPAFIRTPEARDAFRLLSYCDVTIADGSSPPDLSSYDLVIDALLGTGVSGTPRGPYARLIAAANASGAPVLAVDIPSGYGTDCAVDAEEVVSLHVPKVPGALVASIGIPSLMQRRCGPGNVRFLARRPLIAHKRQGGVVAVVGGSTRYHGAPALAGRAAAPVVDLVHMVCPRAAAGSLRAASPDLIIEEAGDGHLDRTLLDAHAVGRADCILCGVGAGRHPETVDALLALMERAGRPLVVDADGLYALRGRTDLCRPTMCLTPHRGEYEALFGPLPEGVRARCDAVEKAALDAGCTILLKGVTDIVSDGVQTWTNTTGNEGMATGGTGDVLAGLCAAFACMNGPLPSACAAAYAAGRAGDAVHASLETFFTADDVVRALPAVLAACRRPDPSL